ncbi:MAG: primosomal protein N' [Candidatus Omnitrophica bacterium]|nr:primosomal protein N' [Candidatus Omnitrophota bacterium]
MIAQVVFNLPIDRAFDYVVPPDWESVLQPGMRVLAPFGRRQLVGYVLKTTPSTTIQAPKTLLRLIDDASMFTSDRWYVARWMTGYYGCSLGEALAAILPTGLHSVKKGDTKKGDTNTLGNVFVSPILPTLTAEQQRAFEVFTALVKAQRFAPFLLHGITGSGKTELYLRVIEKVLEQGRSAICLVPEIALTPQAIDRFRQRFASDVGIWHSRLTPRQRAIAWQDAASGRCCIMVGTRSAVFAPMHRIGLIILDEEHDPSYKQTESPRYHAREVAMARAKDAHAMVILGSATPSVESYDAATRGQLHLLELTQRVQGRALPKVEIVDMRQELTRGRRSAVFSVRLQRALEQTVDLNEQAILLLNRRGFARVAQCPACGTVSRCQACSVPLIYHATTNRLRCHYCNREQDAPETCQVCSRGYVHLRGSGTQRIESELHRLFPASAIARMDADATKPRDSHRRVYDLVTTRQIDLLVGTQMVAKGWDVPSVTLVGVISADTALNLPDFRAGERTFDLLTQVAGRAGRGDRPGRVIIQTFCPTHYAIRAASQHDYHAFYRAEIAMRRRFRLPPCVRLVDLTVQGRGEQRVERAARELATALKVRITRSISLLGPAPHRLSVLRGNHRWHVVLKAKRVEPMLAVVRATLQEGRRFRGLPVIVDVDPQ